jgi:hypothetical protein
MRTTSLVTLLVAGLLVSGCGSNGSDEPVGTAPSAACPSVRDDAVVVLRADLDGDGVREPVEFLPGTAHCAPLLSATVAGHTSSTPLDDDLPVRAEQSFAISVPGRTGEVAVVRQEHPRGGFQVVLLGWSSAGVSTLGVDDRPIVPFVATDTEPSPLTARCVQNGIEVDVARRHEPIGVVPAWDVDRTSYTLNGTSTTAGPTQEIADNVLEKELRTKYADLVDHRLFTNCRAAA